MAAVVEQIQSYIPTVLRDLMQSLRWNLALDADPKMNRVTINQRAQKGTFLIRKNPTGNISTVDPSQGVKNIIDPDTVTVDCPMNLYGEDAMNVSGQSSLTGVLPYEDELKGAMDDQVVAASKVINYFAKKAMIGTIGDADATPYSHNLASGGVYYPVTDELTFNGTVMATSKAAVVNVTAAEIFDDPEILDAIHEKLFSRGAASIMDIDGTPIYWWFAPAKHLKDLKDNTDFKADLRSIGAGGAILPGMVKIYNGFAIVPIPTSQCLNAAVGATGQNVYSSMFGGPGMIGRCAAPTGNLPYSRANPPVMVPVDDMLQLRYTGSQDPGAFGDVVTWASFFGYTPLIPMNGLKLNCS